MATVVYRSTVRRRLMGVEASELDADEVELTERHVLARSLNPIENAWGLLKHSVRRSLQPHFDLNDLQSLEEGLSNNA